MANTARPSLRPLFRPLLLATYAALLLLPWVTTTGCGNPADAPRHTLSGAALLVAAAVHAPAAVAIAVALLVASCALGVVAPRVQRARIAAVLELLAVGTSLAGVAAIAVLSCIAVIFAHNEWHFAYSASIVVLALFAFDAIHAATQRLLRAARGRPVTFAAP